MADERTSEEAPRKRIEQIALSLSGGGVRAVGFHLGLLSMLDRLDLRERVTVLSTVSGGSLTGIGYALSQRFGQGFDRFFGDLYEFLPQINTIETLLSGLAQAQPPVAAGRRDVIAVLANLYDDAYFKKYFGSEASRALPDETDRHAPEAASPRFDTFWDETNPDNHLHEISFNATEFQTGAAFRFQKSRYRSLIGNANIILCEEHARQIRIADIMAASSCIPVGMEPMFFPDDFHWPDDVGVGDAAARPTCATVRGQLRKNLHRKFRIQPDARVEFIALMDGGVYDNQGIVSLLLAMNRMVSKVPKSASKGCNCGESLAEEGGEPTAEEWSRIFSGKRKQGAESGGSGSEDVGWQDIDLLIVSDTPVRKDSIYPKLPTSMNAHNPEDALGLDAPHSIPVAKGLLHRLTVGGAERIMLGAGVLLLASALAAFAKWLVEDRTETITLREVVYGVLQVGLPLLVTGGLGLGLFALHRRLVDLSDKLYGVLPKDRWTRKPWQYIKKLKISDVITMIHLRLSSTSALTANIYMNRIRSLGYAALFSRRDLDRHVVTNEIFALEDDGDGRPVDWPIDLPEHIPTLCEEARAITTLAAHMPTKLWINRIDKGVANYAELLEGDDPITNATRQVLAINEKREANGLPLLTDLDVLVISGQLTACFKIMAHLWQHHRRPSGDWKYSDSEAIFDQSVALWKELHADPMSLLDEQKRRSEEERRTRSPGARTVVVA